MFDVTLFQKHLNTTWLGQDFKYYETIDSTNTYLKKLENNDLCHGAVCLADFQTGGRGQYKRKWLSKPGENLIFSMVFCPDTNKRILVLSLLSACAFADVIEDDYQLKVNIKWPNDLYVKGKKVAGILTETIFSGNKLERIIIGLGLNVNQREFEGEVQTKATSLINELDGQVISREYILQRALKHIEELYILWEENNPDLIKRINKRLIGYGEKVKLSVDGKIADETCTLLGINEEGYILFLDENLDILVYTYQQIRIVDVI
ncbi:MAG TPA: biotin--[acetyl-CoA-carboxylase] ligase [Balneolales bacterium]|nr:biotin--[acetyl-CoA-carboxylase] ligase [Balneolales bacterium]